MTDRSWAARVLCLLGWHRPVIWRGVYRYHCHCRRCGKPMPEVLRRDD